MSPPEAHGEFMANWRSGLTETSGSLARSAESCAWDGSALWGEIAGSQPASAGMGLFPLALTKPQLK